MLWLSILAQISCLLLIYGKPELIPITMYIYRLVFSSWSLVVPLQRITIPEIKIHPWFLKNLPVELSEGGSWQSNDVNNPSQSVEEVLAIIQEAGKPLDLPKAGGLLLGGSSMDLDDLDADADTEDIEMSGDFVCPL